MVGSRLNNNLDPPWVTGLSSSLGIMVLLASVLVSVVPLAFGDFLDVSMTSVSETVVKVEASRAKERSRVMGLVNEFSRLTGRDVG
jgi:hypothetical protein